MSIEQAKEFLVKISTEDEAARKAEEAHFASLLQTATELGYELSGDDLRQAMEDISSFSELSEDQLASVAGGSHFWNDSLLYFKRPRFPGTSGGKIGP